MAAAPDYRCIVCHNIAGTPVPNDKEDWWWEPRADGSRGRSGPLCSKTCVDAFKRWTRPQQLASIFGSYARGIGAEKMRPDLPKRATYKPLIPTLSVRAAIPAGEPETLLEWRQIDWSAE